MTKPADRGRTADWQAGLTVAVVALPQAIATSLLAGVPPAHGLATAALPALVAGVIGGSPQVATGPTITTGLLVLAAMTPFLGGDGLLSAQGLPLLAALTLLVGVMRIAIAWTGGAWLVRFLPESVLVAFAAGAAVLIAALQLDEALGLPGIRAGSFIEQAVAHVTAIQGGARPSLIAMVFAAGTLAMGLWGRKRFPGRPVTLLGVVGATLLGWLCGLDRTAGLALVSDRAVVPVGWPPVALPAWDLGLLRQLFVPASAMVLLGTLELTVTARARGARPDMRREMLAQGWATTLGAFAGCFPASASLTRSALLRLSGARTHWAAALAGLLTIPVVLFSSTVVGRIPLSVLAAVLFLAATEMIDRATIVKLWRASGETRLLLTVTLLGALLLPLEWAVILGAGTSLVVYLVNTTVPRVRVLVLSADRLVPLDHVPHTSVVIEVSGVLHYAAVWQFVEDVERLLPPSARTVVVDLSHAHEMRFTAVRGLQQLSERLAARGVTTWLAGVGDDERSLLLRCECDLPFVAADPEPGMSARRCLERATGSTGARRPQDAPA